MEIKKIVTEIREIEPYWSGVNVPYVADTINLHKSCLISGEGGIGKSYFIMCLEDELEKKGVKHLCMYGKFCEDVSDIDFDQIKMLGQNEEFVFAFDAINEVSKESQQYIVSELEKLGTVPKVVEKQELILKVAETDYISRAGFFDIEKIDYGDFKYAFGCYDNLTISKNDYIDGIIELAEQEKFWGEY